MTWEAELGLFASTPNIIAVHPSVPAKNLSELLELAKAQPGRLNYGSTSLGGSPLFVDGGLVMK